MSREKERVEESAKNYHYFEGVMQHTTKYCGEIFERSMKDGSVLELGPAEGVMTNLLYPKYSDYTVVDGAEIFVDDLKHRFPNIKAYANLFEEFEPEQTYANIVLGHVLEHVENPVNILKLCASWLEDDGVILAAVPNSNSIHRQAAVSMGMLSCVNELNEQDKKNGHRRVYNLRELKKDFEDAGLKIVQAGGYWLKPLSNPQIEATWDEKMINAFLKLGEKYPDIAGEIYVIATK